MEKLNRFKEFLIEHNAYDKFVDELSKDWYADLTFEEFVDECPEFKLISDAFGWGDEYIYWLDLSVEWYECYRVLEGATNTENMEDDKSDTEKV